MTSSNHVQGNEDVIKLTVRLAKPEDEVAIDKLWRLYGRVHGWPAFSPLHTRVSVDANSADNQVLVAHLPDGRMTATVTVGVATSQDQLNSQLGYEVSMTDKEFPAVTMTRGCSLEGGAAFEALRIVVLNVAARMRHDRAGMIMSQVGVGMTPDPQVVLLLLRLGYEMFAVDNGPVLFHQSCIATRLRKGRIMSAISELIVEAQNGNIPSYEWQGPLLFARWMPDYAQTR